MPENTVRKSDKALELAEGNELTSEYLSGELNISRINAANILNRLSKYGHLIKKQINLSDEKISGRYFSYSISSSGKKRLEWLRENGRLTGEVVAFEK